MYDIESSRIPAPVQRRDGGAPQSRLRDLRNSSMQLSQLAAAINDSPRQAAQRKAAPNRGGLPSQLKTGIESLSGMSMDHVKVHYNSSQPAQLNAHAYAQGSDIHVGPGQERHLPHEAWHVVQQAQGRVRPTMQMAGAAINDNHGLEHEADVMGQRALSSGVAQRAGFGGAPATIYHGPSGAPVQRTVHVTYNPSLSVTPRKRIGTVHYTRSGSPLTSAKNWVLANSSVSARPPAAVANHSKDHAAIVTAINANLSGRTTINQVSQAVRGWYNVLYNFVQAPHPTHEGVLEDMSDTTTNPAEDAGIVNDALNWYLTRIADYPSNLFYWPNQQPVGGGHEPGMPNIKAAQLGAHGGWTYVNTRAHERARLQAGRAVLAGQGL